MKKIYLLLVAIIVVVLVWAVARKKPGIIEKPEIDKEYFETGLSHYKKIITFPKEYHEMSSEEYDEHRKMVISSTDSAIKSYQQIIDKYPESRWADDAQFFIAEAYFIRGDWDEAIAAFRKVITNYPEAELEPETIEEDMPTVPKTVSNPHALTQCQIAGIYYNVKKDYPQALIEYNKVIDRYPQDRAATLMAAFDIERCAAATKNYEPAIEAYQKLLQAKPETASRAAFLEKKIKELQAKQAALKKQS